MPSLVQTLTCPAAVRTSCWLPSCVIDGDGLGHTESRAHRVASTVQFPPLPSFHDDDTPMSTLQDRDVNTRMRRRWRWRWLSAQIPVRPGLSPHVVFLPSPRTCYSILPFIFVSSRPMVPGQRFGSEFSKLRTINDCLLPVIFKKSSRVHHATAASCRVVIYLILSYQMHIYIRLIR